MCGWLCVLEFICLKYGVIASHFLVCLFFYKYFENNYKFSCFI